MRKIYLKTAPFLWEARRISHRGRNKSFSQALKSKRSCVFFCNWRIRGCTIQNVTDPNDVKRDYAPFLHFTTIVPFSRVFIYIYSKFFNFFFFFKSISINCQRSKYSTNTEYRREKKKYFIGSRKKNDTLIILLSLILKKIIIIILDEGQRRGDACCTKEGYFETPVHI